MVPRLGARDGGYARELGELAAINAHKPVLGKFAVPTLDGPIFRFLGQVGHNFSRLWYSLTPATEGRAHLLAPCPNSVRDPLTVTWRAKHPLSIYTGPSLVRG